MNKELLAVIESVAYEKNIEKHFVVSAMEAALAMAARKQSGLEIETRVEIDPQTGSYQTFRQWTVVATPEEIENSEAQISLADAHAQDPSLAVGDVIEEEIPSAEFGRIAAQIAKQVIFQKVREAEKEKIISHYENLVGKLVNGSVKRVLRDLLVIDLGKVEGIMPRSEWIPREAFRSGDRIKTYLKEVLRDHRGPQIILSRAHNGMLVELFKLEIPEIGEEVIQIKSVARDLGSRAKIAVKTNDGRIDPVGACVGMKGTRVQNISNELSGERIDVVLWEDNPAQFVINAMAPAKVLSILIDEERHSMDISVSADQLSLAIGKGGQNVRLASKLTGWSLNVMSETDAQEKQTRERKAYQNLFTQQLEIEEDIADALVAASFTTLEEIAYASLEEMLAIEGFDQDIAHELQERAKNALLTQALTGKKIGPSANLLNMPGMDAVTAHALAAKNISTLEDLADQSVEDILDLGIEIDPNKAGELIMTARSRLDNGQ